MIDPQVKALLATCYSDLAAAANAIFPERFHRPFDPIHEQIFRKIAHSDSRYIAIAAPRGIGKTSINNLLLPAWNILFQEARYIVPVSASATLAAQQSENLKRELIGNPLVEKLFGDITTNTFSKEQWVVKIGDKEICVMPRGAGQQVRGLLFGNSRPDLIIVDDLEDPDNIDSEDQRKKKKEWFYGSLLNCVDRGSKDWRVIYIGTVLHEDALLVNLMDDPQWDTISLEICDDDFRSNAPNFMSDEDIKELYEMFVSAGKVDTFYREYRNQASAGGEHSAFQASMFHYYVEDEEKLWLNPDVENIVIIDPAKTVKMNSAESAIVGVGANMVSQAVYVRDVDAGKYHPEELYERVGDMILRLGAKVLGVEVTSLHEFILYPLKNALAQRGIHVEILELHARGGVNEKGKIERVRSMLPLYRAGLVKHNKAVTAPLEAQLLSFPRPKRWDIMDALGYVPQILETGERYMRPYDGAMDSPATLRAEMEEVNADISDWGWY